MVVKTAPALGPLRQGYGGQARHPKLVSLETAKGSRGVGI